MSENKTDYGCFEITLEEYLKNKNISKNSLSQRANLQRTQLLSYCRNTVQRPDLGVLARICFTLGCDISDILKYIPPNSNSSK